MTYIKIIFLLFSVQVYSQNLVLNPSFEKTNECINTIGFIGENISFWSSPTSSTTDFFNTCKKGQTGVPNNFQGFQKPQSGNNYVGFGILRGYSMEYIQGQLAKSLIKGRKYKVSFYINLSDQSNYAVNGFTFLFIDKKINANVLDELNSTKLIELKVEHYSYHSIKSKDFFNDKENWVKVSKEITATGNEKFLIIGDFAKHSKTEKLKVAKKPRKTIQSYYYLDNVSLESLDVFEKKQKTKIDNTIIKELKKQKIELNRDYIFESIVFNLNSKSYLKMQKLRLNQFIKFWKENPILKY